MTQEEAAALSPRARSSCPWQSGGRALGGGARRVAKLGLDARHLHPHKDKGGDAGGRSAVRAGREEVGCRRRTSR